MFVSWHLMRYLSKNLWHWFLIVGASFGTVIAIFDIIDLLRRVSGKVEITGLLTIKMLLCRFPMHFQEILPFVMFFAAILCLWRLNRSYEIIALRAIGLSIWQILFPLVCLSFFIGCVDLMVFSPFSAKLMGRFEYLENRYLNEKQETFEVSETGIWLRERLGQDYRIVHASHMDEEKGQLNRVTVYTFDGNQVFKNRIDAQVAQLVDGRLLLQNLWQADTQQAPQRIKKMELKTGLSFNNIQQSFADPRTLPFWELPYYGDLMTQAGLSSQRYDLQWYTLISKCFWLSIMVVLAACFALGSVRQSNTWRMIILGVAVAFFFYFFKDITAAMGSAGTIPPFMAAFASSCIAALFAITRLLYVEEG